MKTIYFYQNHNLLNSYEVEDEVKSFDDEHEGLTIFIDGDPVEVRGFTYRVTTKPLVGGE